MTRGVDVGVVALLGLVLDVRGVDGNPPLFFLGRVVDRVVGTLFRESLGRQIMRDGRGQGRFTVVDVTNGSDVDVRLLSLKFSSCHTLQTPFS